MSLNLWASQYRLVTADSVGGGRPMSKSFLALVLLDTPVTPDMVALADALRA